MVDKAISEMDRALGLEPKPKPLPEPKPGRGKFRGSQSREEQVEELAPMSLADVMYRLRVALHFSQAEMAERLGCHRNTVINIETGATKKLRLALRRNLEAAARGVGRKDLVKVIEETQK